MEGWACKCIKGDRGLDPDALSYYNHDDAEVEQADLEALDPAHDDGYIHDH